MSHFAFISPPLPGHLNPLLVLAQELRSRGHRTTFINQIDLAGLIGRTGAAFAPIGKSSHPQGSLETTVKRMSRLNGPLGMRRMIADVAAFTHMVCRDAPAALERVGADFVVADQMEPGGGLVAEALGLPFVSVAAALPINSEESVPPIYVGWRYDPSPRGRSRNRGGYRVSDYLMRGVGDVIEHHSRAFGLPPRRSGEECLSPVAQLSQAVAGIDFPRESLPANFHYLGPFRNELRDEIDILEDRRPMIYCSLGSLQGSRASVFRKVASACARLDLRLLIAHGGRLDAAAAAALPGNPIVRDYVPQTAVLRRAAAVVTHAGFNTVLDALAEGLPLVAMPLAFEQGAIAARIVHADVGRIVSARFGTVARLTRELDRVLTDGSYRERAARIAAQIAAAGGVRRAASIIEQCLLQPRRGRAAASTTAYGGADGAHDDNRSGSRSGAT